MFYITNLKSKLSLTFTSHGQLAMASAFLVSVPVFAQAPLVRHAPWLSLILTVGWLGLAQVALQSPQHQKWGSLIWGFSLSWLCGTLYWGWLRQEPLWHLPIEAIALPWAVVALLSGSQKYRIGAWFYLASLLGTALTDVYFYLNNLIPQWRAIMHLEGDLIAIEPILQNAIAQIQTNWGIASAVIIATSITILGCKALLTEDDHHWAFAGALLSSLFVDSLFALCMCWS